MMIMGREDSDKQHTTHPQPHEQLPMGWIVGGTMMMMGMQTMMGGDPQMMSLATTTTDQSPLETDSTTAPVPTAASRC
jgi:hypothetical protein